MSEWKPIESYSGDDEVLLYWPAEVRGAHRQVHLPEMMRVGYPSNTPNRPPTHWMPKPKPPAT